jgi:hypothetical protein
MSRLCKAGGEILGRCSPMISAVVGEEVLT